jgi:hypothetical protein
MSEETITRINGNGQPYTTGLPTLIIYGRINDVALEHMRQNTGLEFVPYREGYKAEPTESKQIVALLLTYNYKTRYYNNWDYKNELHLRSDHHVGFDVSSICLDCVKHNHIHAGDLKQGDRLAC